MIGKDCKKCGEIKSLSSFNKRKASSNGLNASCRSCNKADIIAHSKTKIGLIEKIYKSQKTSSKKRGHSKPTYSLDEFMDWMLSHCDFHRLFNIWKLSNYDTWLIPSVDRLDDYIGYSFGNIQLMTWKENKTKFGKDQINGVNNKQSKSVSCYNENSGELIGTYYSMSKASLSTGVPIGNISKCVSGIRKSAGGLLWKQGDK